MFSDIYGSAIKMRDIERVLRERVEFYGDKTLPPRLPSLNLM
jgi:hypothetical protein